MNTLKTKFFDLVKPRTVSRVEAVALAALLAGSVLIVARVLWYGRYGFDFTDEGFYLHWLSHPFEYKISLSQFGYIYHPLYLALRGDIAALRGATVLLTFGFATCSGMVFLRKFFDKLTIGALPLFIFATALATLSLSWFCRWLTTPSYNSLNLQAFILTLIGMLLAGKPMKGSSLAGWSLIGLGGFFSFMAKPASAALLGFAVALYLFLTGKLRFCTLALAVGIAACSVFVAALLIDGSLFAFIERLHLGTQMLFVMDPNPEKIVRLGQVALGTHEVIRMLLYSSLIAALAILVQFKTWPAKVVLLSVSWGVLLVMVGMTTAKLTLARYFGLSFLPFAGVAPLAALLTGWCCRRSAATRTSPKERWTLAAVLLVMPYIFAFGSDVDYWWLGVTSAVVFWLFCGMTSLARLPTGERLKAALIPLCAAAQLSAMAWIEVGIQGPRRQPQPLPKNNVDFSLGEPSSHLILAQDTAAYLAEAGRAAAAAGFRPGMSMIDLSGVSPGLLYALSAVSKGRPWFNGGYPDSEARITFVLRRVACASLVGAWILDEPQGPVRLSPEVLASFGADLAADYMPVAEFYSSAIPNLGPKGYGIEPRFPQKPEHRKQVLLKPTRDPAAAETACKQLREGAER